MTDSPLTIVDLSNEEELKIKFLVPLLERLGVQRSELTVERSFKFHAGRQTLEEDLGKALTERRPRLDFLVTRSERNLFIVEAKRPGSTLDDAARLQAISYARLVHPIAPYALVTNGEESLLYDTVTRKQIEPQEVRFDGFEIVLPGADDFDALACFLRLSRRNLLRFSEAQTQEAMRPIRGSAVDLAKKYIPELHQPREVVDQALHRFSSSENSVMALVGESGMGKTCTMCHAALKLHSSGQPVLFFRGSELQQRFPDELAEEFAWTFTETNSLPVLIRRLSQIVSEGNLLVFLDAIDEWHETTARQQLGAFARHLVGTPVKLVISCKAPSWPTFLESHGSPTDLATYLERHNGKPGLEVGGFAEDEFYQALDKYKEVYDFNGVWERVLLEEAKRSPFFMRIAFEVAKQQGWTEIRESSREIYESYYQNCLEKTDDIERSGVILSRTAQALFDSNSDRMDIGRLRSVLQLRPVEEMPEALFQYGILERVPSEKDPLGAVRYAFEPPKLCNDLQSSPLAHAKRS